MQVGAVNHFNIYTGLSIENNSSIQNLGLQWISLLWFYTFMLSCFNNQVENACNKHNRKSATDNNSVLSTNLLSKALYYETRAYMNNSFYVLLSFTTNALRILVGYPSEYAWRSCFGKDRKIHARVQSLRPISQIV